MRGPFGQRSKGRPEEVGLHQTAGAQVSAEEFLDAVQVRHQVNGFYAAQFAKHLGAMRFPLINEVLMAIVCFQESHDFVGWKVSKISCAQNPAMNGESEDSAGEIAI